MHKVPAILFGFIALLILAGGIAYLAAMQPVQDTPVSNTEDAEVRTLVDEFGKTLKNVPLLADDVAIIMEREYRPYVASELIAKWQSREAEAPGRYSSSPWPDRIDIVSIQPRALGGYTVEGNVIEVATGPEAIEPAAVYPLTLAVERTETSWHITDLTKGAYSPLPQRVTIIGYWECLPHRDQSGPQTMECALGIALDQSDGHVAVNTALMSTYPVDFPTGTKVKASGVLTPANQLSSDHWQKYDIDGILNVTEIVAL